MQEKTANPPLRETRGFISRSYVHRICVQFLRHIEGYSVV